MKHQFCTCKDLKCPYHPSNHDEGCNLCIQKNLTQKEIPPCFFRSVKKDLTNQKDYSFDAFCKILKENKK